MNDVIRIGVDTSKSVFQLHGVDGREQPVLRRKLRRQDVLKFFSKLKPTTVGLEACGASHYWARELAKLGHEVVLIPPQYVKAYVGRNKNDEIDAEAICEAMSRPKVQRRFVPVKSVEQQSLQAVMTMRASLMKRRTQVSNAIRGHAAEFGLTVPKGLAHIEALLARVEESAELPTLVRASFLMLKGQYRHADAQIREVDRWLELLHRSSELACRLSDIPTVGLIGSMALAARANDANRFRSGRDFSAFLGLTAKNHSTAGKTRLGVITRAGDEMLRSTLVCGAMAVIQQVKRGRTKASPWLEDLLARKPEKLAAVALANKTARIAWRLMISGQHYDPNRAAPCASEAVDMWAGQPLQDHALLASPT